MLYEVWNPGRGGGPVINGRHICCFRFESLDMAVSNDAWRSGDDQRQQRPGISILGVREFCTQVVLYAVLQFHFLHQYLDLVAWHF